jgi:tetratricopeptide (TPR) repeat protein
VLLPIGGFAQSEKSKLWDAYIAAGDKAYGEERYEIAEIMFLAARKEADYFGPHNHRVATTLYRLAHLYRLAPVFKTEGKLNKAPEPLYQQALAIWEKDLGPEPSDVAGQINQLATTYYEGGKYLEAVALYERARAIGKDKSEPGRPTVAIVFSNIALVHQNQGIEGAERLFKQLLAIMQQAPDKETLDVSQALIYLRELNGKKDDADVEKLYNQALKIQVKTLGSRASEFAIVMNGLSHLYYTQEEFSKAEPPGKRALEIQREVLAPDDPSITTTLNSLAELYSAEMKYAEAEPLYEQVLAMRTKAVGPASVKLVDTLNKLGRVYKQLQKYPAAESKIKQALTILENATDSERAETSDIPGMAEILNNLSHVYFLQGEYDKAEPLLKRARKEKSDESKTLYLKNLTVLYLAKGRQYMQQGRHAEAEPILQQVIAFYMDPSHQLDRPSVPDLASMLDEYSSELGKLNRVAAADEWHARAEAMRKNNPPQN